jgi:SAM-dependent methyltransferase
MRITMSPQDYATAFRLLATTARHHETIGQVVEERIVPRLPERPSLLDVGAGPGTVARRLAPRFGSLTLLEPNREQLAGFELPGVEVLHDTLERFRASRTYDVVLCSHVLYHVPIPEWGGFVDRLLALVEPGGFCVIVLGAANGQNYELHRDFTRTVITSEQLLAALKQKQLPHEVVRVTNGFFASSFEEMYTLCRFFVLEDCCTPEQLSALSEEEVLQLDAKIRLHTERCRGADGVYRLEQDEDVVILRKPRVA